MKKYALLLGAMVLVAACAPAFAQTFSDVPTDHWAYQAVQELADKGYVVGYPDGTFGGKRALTRYEFAMAVSRILSQIQTGGPTGNFATKEEVNALSKRVSALEQRPGTVSGDFASKADLDKVRRLVDEFRDELATLGVDVDAMKREIADLRTRVDAIENTLSKLPKISAESNLIFRGETTRTGRLSPEDIDGRIIDNDNRILQGVAGLYDLDLTIQGNVTDKVKAVGVFNAGNYLNWLESQVAGFGLPNAGVSVPASAISFANDFLGTGLFQPESPSDAAEEITPWLLYLNSPVSLGPLGEADLTVGKFPLQFTPYTLKMIDVDSYTYNAKTDSGDYPMLGASAAFRLGGVSVVGYAAKHDGSNVPPLATAFGIPYFVGPFGAGLAQVGLAEPNPIEQSAGIRATVGVPFGGTLGATYIQGAAPGIVGTDRFDRLGVWGADLGLNLFRNLGLNASWTHAQWQNDEGDKPEGWTASDAWDARLSIPVGKLSISAGYREVQPNFIAPGYWGNIGFVRNPTDIKGPLVNVSYPISSKLSLTAGGEFYEGTKDQLANGVDILSENEDLRRYTAGLKFALGSANSLDLGYERVDLKSGGETSRQSFINIGVGHSFNPNTSLKLLYQIVDFNQPDLGEIGSPRGGVAVGQFSVKF